MFVIQITKYRKYSAYCENKLHEEGYKCEGGWSIKNSYLKSLKQNKEHEINTIIHGVEI